MEGNKEHLLKYYKEGIRYDGRKLNDYREVTVEYGISESAEGSARVKIGQTEVLAGVKMGLEKPYPDTPDKGNLMVNAELMALSSPEFEPGPPTMYGVELARVIDRGIRESKTIDATKLCIEKGEKVWSVMIDICTINDDGNLMDAAGLAAIAALRDAKFPKIEDGTVNYEEKTDEGLPLERTPIAVTIWKIGENFIVDPLPIEQKSADARLTVGVTEKDTVSAMQKGEQAPLTIEEIDKMVGIAIEKSNELRKKL